MRKNAHYTLKQFVWIGIVVDHIIRAFYIDHNLNVDILADKER